MVTPAIGSRCALALTLTIGCASEPRPAPSTTTPAPAATAPSAHHDHRGGMPHRFENADEWAKQFDDPSRDAWQHPDDVISRLGRAREQSLDRSVGRREQGRAVAPVLGERQLVERVRIGRDLDLLTGERHARTPRSSSARG